MYKLRAQKDMKIKILDESELIADLHNFTVHKFKEYDINSDSYDSRKS